MSLTAGFRFGSYEIVAPLGAGGMGEVYRARDTKLNRDAAIKVLPEVFARDPDRLARFTREAQTLAALNHPNIAQIYGFEESSGIRALAMELVDGEDLSARIARGRLPVADALEMARQIAGALAAAHEQGIVHRDLKPANIKVRRDGAVKILDFGLAKALNMEGSGAAVAAMNSPTSTGHATEMGVVIGTAAYMSPEQARGKPVDRRADVWAFGAVLYEMLSGQRLFAGETASDMIAGVLRDVIDWNAIPPATPDPVKRLLARCLERDITRRLEAMGEAHAVLEQAVVAARDANPGFGPRVKPGRRSPSWVLAAAVLLLIATGVGGWITWGRREHLAGLPVTPASRSIAVLPFVNSSGNADDEYLADGMTDELISGLGKVPGLRVAARSSAFSFKGQKAGIREVAAKLSVDSVLEGTVRRSGKRLRVTASLVSAADGLQIWTSTFESDGGDPFAVQDEVTHGVVSGLSLQLGGAALAATQAGRTSDPEAHDLYLRGLQAAQNAASETDLRRALDFYRQALARDPAFALAYAGISVVHIYLADAYVAPNEAYPMARAAAEAALERDSQLAEAHAAKAFAAFSIDWDWATADREFSRALELNPNSVDTLLFLGTYRCAGHADEGLAALDRAARLDPLSPLPRFSQEFCSYFNGRYSAVIELHRKTQALAPSFVYIDSWVGGAYRELGNYEAAMREYSAAGKLLNGVPQYGLALTYVKLGRDGDARDVMRRLDEHARTHYVPYYLRAAVHAALGDMDEAVVLLQRAVDTREVFVHTFRRLPETAPLRNDVRAQRIFAQADALRKLK